MTLDELVLHNFGVYGARQLVALTPKPGRPITLFGGLNGGGKTTLLDALQLCLYGPSARCSNRAGLAYDDFLRRSIHRRANAPEAAIELAFRHTTNGEEQEFRLHRSWRASTSGCRESFHVLRNGELDKLATDHWGEQVEDFIPARIAHLFLFDGEKIESYAELDGAPALIATAIQNLLGLDIVEQLVADLGVLERRKRTEAVGPTVSTASTDARAKIEELEGTRAGLVRARAAAANVIDRRRAELSAAEERYRREGGSLFERRGELEREVAANERQLASAQKELRDLAAGATPLLLVRNLIDGLVARDATENQARQNRTAVATVAGEHEALLALPALDTLSTKHRSALAAALKARLDARRDAAGEPVLLDLTSEGRTMLGGLTTGELPSAEDRTQVALASEREAAAALDHTRNTLAASPSPDAIAGILATRETAQAEVAWLQSEHTARDAEITRLDREIEQLREREARLAESEARERFGREDVQRLLVHSTKVRGTLARFREAVVVRHVARIERFVLESFHQLVRKRSLVADLRIDPGTFILELRGADGRPMTPDRLSAGERQLLAIAILWGLGKSSGRPLPTVIDTPLGRLDSIHRTHLVKRYFPHASHQVLLLSTDEEITGSYYDALLPSINRTYHLRFEECEGRTIIEPGYLGTEAVHVHAH